MYCILVGLSLLVLPSSAYAYIDPGTGSVIVQAIVAGIVGALFTIKMYWRSFKGFVTNLFRRSN